MTAPTLLPALGALALLALTSVRAQDSSAPIEPAPFEPTPLEPAPIEPAPLEPTPFDPNRDEPSLFVPEGAKPTPVEPTSASQPKVEPSGPNIILIVANDHATQAISPYLQLTNSWLQSGDEITPFTPHLTRLAAEGALFESAWTTGLDPLATRRALLNGSHPVAGSDSKWTLAAELRDHGYQTALFGYWPSQISPAQSGFSHWEITEGRSRTINPLYVGSDGRHIERGHEIVISSTKTRRWIGVHSRGDYNAPFFVVCQFESPGQVPVPLPLDADHWGPELLRRAGDLASQSGNAWRFHPVLPMAPLLIAPEPEQGSESDDDSNADPSQIPLLPQAQVETLAEDYPSRGADGWFTGPRPRLHAPLDRLDEHQRPRWTASLARRNELRRQAEYSGFLDSPDAQLRWEQQRFLRQYLGAARSIDREIGELLDFLETQGLDENTLVVYTSDQGKVLGQRGLIGQDNRDPASLQIPLLMRWPAEIAAGTRLEEPVQSIDLVPTLLELVGIRRADLRADQDIQGQDLANRLRGLVEGSKQRSLYFADQPKPPWQASFDGSHWFQTNPNLEGEEADAAARELENAAAPLLEN